MRAASCVAAVLLLVASASLCVEAACPAGGVLPSTYPGRLGYVYTPTATSDSVTKCSLVVDETDRREGDQCHFGCDTGNGYSLFGATAATAVLECVNNEWRPQIGSCHKDCAVTASTDCTDTSRVCSTAAPGFIDCDSQTSQLHGATCSYSCRSMPGTAPDFGYGLTSGTATYRCVEGDWVTSGVCDKQCEEEVPFCKSTYKTPEFNCLPLSSSRRLLHSPDCGANDGEQLAGTTCGYACASPYVTTGETTYQCGTDGLWSTTGNCGACGLIATVTGEDLQAGTSGSVVDCDTTNAADFEATPPRYHNGLAHAAQCHFACASGYTMVNLAGVANAGPAFYTCTNGVNVASHVCRPQCNAALLPAHAGADPASTSGSFDFGDTVSYTCDDATGYFDKLTDTTEYTCGYNAQTKQPEWTRTGSCVRGCAAPVTADFTTDNYAEPSSACTGGVIGTDCAFGTSNCATGYSLMTAGTTAKLTCTAPITAGNIGTWESTARCADSCPVLTCTDTATGGRKSYCDSEDAALITLPEIPSGAILYSNGALDTCAQVTTAGLEEMPGKTCTFGCGIMVSYAGKVLGFATPVNTASASEYHIDPTGSVTSADPLFPDPVAATGYCVDKSPAASAWESSAFCPLPCSSTLADFGVYSGGYDTMICKDETDCDVTTGPGLVDRPSCTALIKGSDDDSATGTSHTVAPGEECVFTCPAGTVWIPAATTGPNARSFPTAQCNSYSGLSRWTRSAFGSCQWPCKGPPPQCGGVTGVNCADNGAIDDCFNIVDDPTIVSQGGATCKAYCESGNSGAPNGGSQFRFVCDGNPYRTDVIGNTGVAGFQGIWRFEGQPVIQAGTALTSQAYFDSASSPVCPRCKEDTTLEEAITDAGAYCVSGSCPSTAWVKEESEETDVGVCHNPLRAWVETSGQPDELRSSAFSGLGDNRVSVKCTVLTSVIVAAQSASQTALVRKTVGWVADSKCKNNLRCFTAPSLFSTAAGAAAYSSTLTNPTPWTSLAAYDQCGLLVAEAAGTTTPDAQFLESTDDPNAGTPDENTCQFVCKSGAAGVQVPKAGAAPTFICTNGVLTQQGVCPAACPAASTTFCSDSRIDCGAGATGTCSTVTNYVADDSTCLFRCASATADYIVNGAVETPVDKTLICTDGAWTLPTGGCKQRCTAPPSAFNIDLMGGADACGAKTYPLAHGSTCTAGCVTGQQPNAAATVFTCEDGAWVSALKCGCSHLNELPTGTDIMDRNGAALGMPNLSCGEVFADPTVQMKNGESCRLGCELGYHGASTEVSCHLGYLRNAPKCVQGTVHLSDLSSEGTHTLRQRRKDRHACTKSGAIEHHFDERTGGLKTVQCIGGRWQ